VPSKRIDQTLHPYEPGAGVMASNKPVTTLGSNRMRSSFRQAAVDPRLGRHHLAEPVAYSGTDVLAAMQLNPQQALELVRHSQGNAGGAS
jgi:hypothetical protein